MNGVGKKIILVLLLAVYIISPIDACPGPIDDIFASVIAFIMAVQKNAET